MSSLTLRLLTPADAEAVLALQQRVYPPTHWERWAVLGAKQALYPAGCWAAVDAQDRLLAYLFSHPWRRGTAPALHGELTQLPSHPDCYALHDLALAPEARGQGLARRLVDGARAHAQGLGLTTLTLVAVQNSAGFWQRMGFEPCGVQDASLLSYGANAVAMVAG
ncbi:GNAT family N-acetyltransferase [Inhella gelatinilytica]|uniref:GNAT family N-acetyltransferase n=1 Tax=Inhella gelatinilytica TaxID=2795030 RepID=A0A931IY02_9BURK|nr:GNAT family N-acetyltransferase [Inhella gelatinilytica]MBH9551911.1 GNAT family N-acetyltransferase [Inhella gelatinilytica]